MIVHREAWSLEIWPQDLNKQDKTSDMVGRGLIGYEKVFGFGLEILGGKLYSYTGYTAVCVCFFANLKLCVYLYLCFYVC